jgi:hypothetical protein
MPKINWDYEPRGEKETLLDRRRDNCDNMNGAGECSPMKLIPNHGF